MREGYIKKYEFSGQIFETYQKMLGENRFLQEDELNESYALFKSNFGPKKLMSLDGELLPETMFNHGNRRSLVYWLEFKSDAFQF
jgi:5-methylcytosine-specific restriction protein B